MKASQSVRITCSLCHQTIALPVDSEGDCITVYGQLCLLWLKHKDFNHPDNFEDDPVVEFGSGFAGALEWQKV